MLHQYTTNEFKNSAVAKNKSDVRTTWAESKAMVYTTAVVLTAAIITFLHQF